MFAVRFAVIFEPSVTKGVRGFFKRLSISKQIISLLKDFDTKFTGSNIGNYGGYYEIIISGSDTRFLDDIKYEISRIDNIQCVECIPMTYQIGVSQENYL